MVADLPPWFSRVTALMAPTLLSALVVTSVLAAGRSWSVGAHTVGVAVAAVMLWRRWSLVLCVVAAVLVTRGTAGDLTAASSAPSSSENFR